MSDFKEVGETNESSKKCLDMAKIQAAMDGERERQAKELQEDLEKFNNRPRPPWAEARLPNEPHPDATQPPEEVSSGDKPEQVTTVNKPSPDTVNSTKEAIQESHVADPPPGHRPKSAVGDIGDAERAESGAEKTEKERFMGYGRSPERG